MLLSIITVTYNAAAFIEETIQSVIPHLTTDIEYLVIDGGSTDGTLDILNKYKQHITRVVSEPDKGIYDAMNKGICQASGRFVYFINCGDTLQHIPLSILQENTTADLIAFPVSINGAVTMQPAIGYTTKLTNTLPHQGIFYKRMPTLAYDLSYKTYADYALNLDCIAAHKCIMLLQEPIVARHNTNGVSNNKNTSKEFFRLVKNKSGYGAMILSYLYFKMRAVKQRLK